MLPEFTVLVTHRPRNRARGSWRAGTGDRVFGFLSYVKCLILLYSLSE